VAESSSKRRIAIDADCAGFRAMEKIKSIRAALAHVRLAARRAHEHNDANVLALDGKKVTTREVSPSFTQNTGRALLLC
jgi:ribose 5-phosphate isomerase RpiB